MAKHELKLATTAFEAIASGTKTIESRLFDEKRQTIQVGDAIYFINRSNPTQIIQVKVVGLLHYKTFLDLFSHNNPEKFGAQDTSWLLNQINEFYSLEDQKKHGVVGIEFLLL